MSAPARPNRDTLFFPANRARNANERIVLGGSPPPRRPRRQRRAPPPIIRGDSDENVYRDLVVAKDPIRSVSDDMLRHAFGLTAIHVAGQDGPPAQAHVPSVLAQPAEEDDASKLDAMKKLSLEEMLAEFRGDSTPATFDASPWRDSPPIWPPLPPGPPPAKAWWSEA